MLDTLYKSPLAASRLRTSPLGPWLDGFVAELSRQGYPAGSCLSYVVLAADLGRWMAGQQLKVTALCEPVIGDYVEQRGTQHDRRRVAATHMLAHLRAGGVIPPRVLVEDRSRSAVICRRYEVHLREERGAAPGTIEGYVAVVRSFLDRTFVGGPLDLDALTADDVGGFLLARADQLSPKRLDYMACALRSFLRHLFSRGETSRDLSTAALGAQIRHPARIPCHLKPEEVERLIATADPATRSGSRDRAILLILARLGLRAGEVAALELNDIRWRSAEVVVRSKGNVVDRLPLPSDVGKALSQYLVEHRPRSDSRKVFLRLCAPIKELGGRSAISNVVRRRLRRAGLHPPRMGAHVLRHSLGTHMVCSGATMAEISEVLRHHSPGSAEIYARVDLEALRALAPPWPGTGGDR